jgi:UDP-N-acetylglucosamine/UDP-N-acetylgalactosamine 4-epimerase
MANEFEAPQEMAVIENLRPLLEKTRSRWLVTGGAGFIGSAIVEVLLKLQQTVTVLDNLETGHQRNIDSLKHLGESLNNPLNWIQGDIRNLENCEAACANQDYVLHQAALGSVPRSINQPLGSHSANVDGFINMIDSARRSGVRHFVYASSSSVYGSSPELPKQEAIVGDPLSPYAATKAINELYANVFSLTYGLRSSGLRYFNVFGRRQDPNGPYAAVIPRWTAAILGNSPIIINGDGTTSRDFCYVDNAVQANIRAALRQGDNHQVFNVACNERTNLNQLASMLRATLAETLGVKTNDLHFDIRNQDFRKGDVMHSLAAIDKAKQMIGYEPTHLIQQGLNQAMPWYVANRELIA